MFKEVYEFNKIRNGFEYNVELESKMLKEEITEFFEADSLAERVDAYIDTEYVYFGTEMKTIAAGVENGFDDLYLRAKNMMQNIIAEEVGYENLEVIITKARKIVCDANAIKGKKLVDGKVSKENYNIDATSQISKMIDEVLKQKIK